jgi:hypothetical protein
MFCYIITNSLHIFKKKDKRKIDDLDENGIIRVFVLKKIKSIEDKNDGKYLSRDFIYLFCFIADSKLNSYFLF